MPKISEVCHVRSKNAGPFWVTVDFFFHDAELYARYRDTPALAPEVFERLYGASAEMVKRTPVDSLNIIKISYPRKDAQGWRGERDMHSGQQFARLLAIELD